jgi:hypothetical protein
LNEGATGEDKEKEEEEEAPTQGEEREEEEGRTKAVCVLGDSMVGW